MDAPKKRTNEFVFTTVLLVFARFLGESMAWQICFWNYLTFNSVWKKNLLMKIQTFRNLLSTQHASNLCFSSQACQLTMGKIYKNKKDPHLTLAEKNNIKRREKCFVTKIVLTYCEKKNVLVIGNFFFRWFYGLRWWRLGKLGSLKWAKWQTFPALKLKKYMI